MNRLNRWTVTCLVVLGSACGSATDEKGAGEAVVVVDNSAATDEDAGQDRMTAPEQDDEVTDSRTEDLPPACGDGTLDPAEACDDGNTLDKDGCSSDCEIETVVLRNLEATLNEGDDMTRCGEGTNYACEANYGISLTLSNFTELPVARISNIRVRFGDVEMSTGGTYCEDDSWLVDAMSTSEIINLGVRFHGSRYDLNWICNDPSQADFVSEYVEDRDYIEAADVEFEISGLLRDGSVWETVATTTIKDLR